MREIILVGGFSEIIELCELLHYKIVGIIDNVAASEIRGYPVLGSDNDAAAIKELYPNAGLVITPDQPKLREKLATYYRGFGFEFESLISPKATISSSARIGNGVVICNGANISAETCIGDFVKVNVNANLMHNSQVKVFTTIAPNAVVLGYVEIGSGSYIGANATILPNVKVAAYATVGAGAVVTRNVVAGTTVKGVPAK